MGRLFVYFEELQIFSKAEWLAVDTEMKDIITSKWGSYTDKYEKRIETDNINNIMITTNHNFKGVNGRWYFVIDISTKYEVNLDKPLRCASYYKIDDLKKISIQLHLPFENTKKQQLYDSIQNVLNKLNFWTN